MAGFSSHVFRAAVDPAMSESRGGWRSLRSAALCLGIAALLQPGAYARDTITLEPSFAVAGIYDDNLFFSTRPEEDYVTRLSPAFDAGYSTALFSLAGRYAFDAEVFLDHPGLDTALARQLGALDVRLAPGRRVVATTAATYTSTLTPGELNLHTGLDTGRERARRVTVEPAIVYEMDARTHVGAGYHFARDSLSDGLTGNTHAFDMFFERRLGARDSVRASYTHRRFRFEGGDLEWSHVPALGWTHDLRPGVSISLTGGPRFSGDSIDPELSVSVRRDFAHAELAMDYARSQSTVVGQSGSVATENVNASLKYAPRRNLEIRAGAGYFHGERGSATSSVYKGGLDVNYRFTRALSVFARYQYAHQRGDLAATGDPEFTRNLVMIGIAAAYPGRRTASTPE